MKKDVLKTMAFVAIGFILYCTISIIFIPKKYVFEDDVYGFNDQMSDFYSQPRDSIDVLVLGASHPNMSILPVEIYNDYGITSYNLATSSQTIETSELLLLEALKYQKPKAVLLDVSRLFDDKSSYTDMDYNKNYRAIMGVRNILLRMVYLAQMCPEDQTYVEYASPIYRFHDRWSKLCSDDFFSYKKVYPKFLYGGMISVDVNPWYENSNKRHEQVRVQIDDEYEVSDEDVKEVQIVQNRHTTCLSYRSLKYFDNIKRICDENGMELICIKAPTAASWSYRKYLLTGNYMRERNIDYIDFMYGNVGVEYDWNDDTNDNGLHANYFGALKTTAFLGEYLKDLNIFEDHRGDENYSRWDTSYVQYTKYVEELLMTDEDKSHDFLRTLSENQGKRVILIAVLDDVAHGWNAEWSEDFASLGLKNDFSDNYRSSYIAYIDDGKLIYEDYGDASLLYKGVFTDSEGKHKVELRSEGMRQGNECLIQIDGINYQVDKKGFNIVVYDKQAGEVIESVAIDTFPPVWFYSLFED